MEEIFGRNGLIARHHLDYEYRPGQLAMAQAVAEALDQRRHLLVEAGTGIGKTLAYLVRNNLDRHEKSAGADILQRHPLPAIDPPEEVQSDLPEGALELRLLEPAEARRVQPGAGWIGRNGLFRPGQQVGLP